MKFTASTPTEPGFYAWKADKKIKYPDVCEVANLEGDESHLICFKEGLTLSNLPSGLWCRLVPVDEQRAEGFNAGLARAAEMVRSQRIHSDFSLQHQNSEILMSAKILAEIQK